MYYVEGKILINGLLIQLDIMGIKAKMYNWIMDFLLNRTIQVQVILGFIQQIMGPHKEVFVLFNILLNDIFAKIGQGNDKSDDGALWKRRNVAYVESSLQKLVNEMNSFRL